MDSNNLNSYGGPGGPGGPGDPGGPQKDVLILFMHESSKACQKLKSYIPNDKSIQVVNIENLQNIPTAITSIPALIINNNKILKGKEVFDYFSGTDEMEFINFTGKNSGFSFSNIDNDNIESNYNYSSINNMEYVGVPKWDEKKIDEQIDIEKYKATRNEII